MTEIFERLKAAAGPNGFSEDPNEIEPYLQEWRGRTHGKSALLLKPQTTEQISAILSICHQTGTHIVPQGGNTGLVGGHVAEKLATQGARVFITQRSVNPQSYFSEKNLDKFC